MMKNVKSLTLVVLPILLITAIFIAFGNNTKSNRENPNPDAEEFESRIEDESAFEKETKDTKLTELETKTLAEGEGDETVAAGDKVTVHYRGWLAKDGTVFDQSFNAGDKGYTFTAGPTGAVIKGWQEGVIGMKQGEVRRLYIPSEQAYGTKGQGSIGPNEDLIFDVELISENN